MNGFQLPWILVSLAVVAVATFAAVRTARRAGLVPRRARGSWLVAALASGAMLVFVAAQVVELEHGITVVDVGVVAAIGLLTGLFLGLALASAGLGPTTQD